MIVGTASVRVRVISDSLAGDIDRSVRDQLRDAMAAVDKDAQKAGERIGTQIAQGIRDAQPDVERSGTDAGEAIGNSIDRALRSQLRDAQGRFIRAGEDLADQVGEGADRSTQSWVRRVTDRIRAGFAQIEIPAINTDALQANVLRLGGSVRDFSADLGGRALDAVNGFIGGSVRLAGGLVQPIAMLGLLGLAVGGLVPVVAGAATAIGEMAGITALLPALGLAAAAVMVTLKLGLAGGFSEGSVQAQRLKGVLEGMKPAFEGLRAHIQDNLFMTLQEPIHKLIHNYLPILKTGLGGIADEMNTAGRAAIAFFNTSKSQEDTATGLANTREMMKGLTTATTPALQAFRDLAVVGSGFLPMLGKAIGDAATRFGAFIANARETGQIQVWIEKGIQAFKDLWGILVNVKDILSGIFNAGEGESFLGTLRAMTKQFADLVNHPAVQAGLAVFFDKSSGAATSLMEKLGDQLPIVLGAIAPVAAEASEALSGAIGAAVQSIAPLITELAPVLAGIVKQITPVLTAVMQAVGPAISGAMKGIIPALQQLSNLFVALLPSVIPIVNIIGQLVSILGQGLSGILEALRPMLGFLAGAFVQIAQAIVPLADQLMLALVDIFRAFAPVIVQVAAVLGPLIAQLVAGLVPVVVSLQPVLIALVTIFGQLLMAIAPLIAQLITALMPILGQLTTQMPAIVALFAALVPVIIQLLPVIIQLVPALGQILLAVLPLIVQIGTGLLPVLTTLAEFLSGVVVPAINMLVPVFVAVIEGVVGILQPAFDLITQIIKIAIGIWNADWSMVWNAILDIFRAFGDAISAAVELVLGIISAITGANLTEMKAAWQSIWSDIKSIVVTVTGFIVDVIKGFAQILWSIIVGLKDVMVGQITGMWEIIKGIWNAGVELVVSVFTGMKDIVLGIISAFAGLFTGNWQAMRDGLARIWEGVTNILTAPLQAAFHIIEGIVGAIKAVVGGIIDFVKGVASAVGDVLGGINADANEANAVAANVAGMSAPGLAEGGIVQPTPGGLLARIGEAGRAERVEPLDRNGLSARDRALVEHLAGGLGNGDTAGVVPEVNVFIGQEALDRVVDVRVEQALDGVARSLTLGRRRTA